MNVVVDTSAWSLALRRRRKQLSPAERRVVIALRELLTEDRAVLIGVVRQELLCGVADPNAFERMRTYLRDIPDEPLTLEDFEEAARCDNLCRAEGIAASPVDMLVCSVARRLSASILTTDPDFQRYAPALSLHLFATHP